MVEETKSRISALMDGELEAREAQASLAAMREDAEARAAWRTYHLISDALQGRAMLGMRCAHRVAARLVQEPALIGPLPAAVAAAQRPRWFVPSALAASLAAVALVGWMALAPQPHTGPGIGERLLFLGLCAGVVVYWALQYHPFVLPNNDYGSFEDTARSLAAMQADPPAICKLSIGGCWIDPDAEWNDWYARADAALYRAKRDGGDTIAWHAAGES